MRYRFLVLIVALCVPFSLSGQTSLPCFSSEIREPQPLIVDTCRPTPTIIKTYEPFIQVYRVRHLDLKEQGLEIEVLEEEMKPENLSVVPFEVSRLEIQKGKIGDLYVEYYIYTFRIINPKKGDYKIPKIRFRWIVKEVGRKDTEVRVRETETIEVPVRYNTTITKDPDLSIRDEIDLGSYRKILITLRALFAIIILCSAFLVFSAIKSQKRRKAEKIEERKREEKEEENPLPSRINRQEFVRSLDLFLQSDRSTLSETEVLDKLFGLVRAFILNEVKELSWTHTAKEIYDHISVKVSGERKPILLELSSRLRLYERDMGVDEFSLLGRLSLDFEVPTLKGLAKRLAWYNLAAFKIKKLIVKLKALLERRKK
ncbi:MAG: hypothetical protein AAB884_00725 [Patescibacteria group bacterium]